MIKSIFLLPTHQLLNHFVYKQKEMQLIPKYCTVVILLPTHYLLNHVVYKQKKNAVNSQVLHSCYSINYTKHSYYMSMLWMNQKKQQWQSKHRICLFSRYEVVWDNKPLKMLCNILSVWVQERPIYFFIYTHLEMCSFVRWSI